MQSRLWSRLPPELLERVLLFLPSSVQARLQHVCKAWRSLLASSRFQEKSTRVALACRRNTLCYRKLHGYLLQRHHLSLHNVRVDLSFVPDRFRTGYRDWRDQRSWFGGRATRVSLLCLSESGIPEVSGVHGSIYSVRLCVVDLARRTCMELPPVDLPAECSVGFDSGELTEEESGVFRITLLSAVTEKATAWVASYSSRVGTWNVGNVQPRLVMSSSCGYVGMVMCKDSSVCIVYSDDFVNEAATYKVEISDISSLWASRQRLSLETVTIAHLIMDGFHDSQFKPDWSTEEWFLFEYNGDLLWIRHDHVWWAGDDSYGDGSDDPDTDTDTVGRVSISVMKKSKGNEQVLVRPQWLSGIVVAKASSVTSWLANDTILLTFTSSRAGEDMVFAYHLQQNSWQHLSPPENFNTSSDCLPAGVPPWLAALPMPQRTTRYKTKDGRIIKVTTVTCLEWMDYQGKALNLGEMELKRTRAEIERYEADSRAEIERSKASIERYEAEIERNKASSERDKASTERVKASILCISKMLYYCKASMSID